MKPKAGGLSYQYRFSYTITPDLHSQTHRVLQADLGSTASQAPASLQTPPGQDKEALKSPRVSVEI